MLAGPERTIVKSCFGYVWQYLVITTDTLPCSPCDNESCHYNFVKIELSEIRPVTWYAIAVLFRKPATKIHPICNEFTFVGRMDFTSCTHSPIKIASIEKETQNTCFKKVFYVSSFQENNNGWQIHLPGELVLLAKRACSELHRRTVFQ
jgi:hypothetical protein